MRNDGRSEFQMIGMNTIETNTIFQLAKSTSNMPTKLIPERSITTKTFTFGNIIVHWTSNCFKFVMKQSSNIIIISQTIYFIIFNFIRGLTLTYFLPEQISILASKWRSKNIITNSFFVKFAISKSFDKYFSTIDHFIILFAMTYLAII